MDEKEKQDFLRKVEEIKKRFLGAYMLGILRMEIYPDQSVEQMKQFKQDVGVNTSEAFMFVFGHDCFFVNNLMITSIWDQLRVIWWHIKYKLGFVCKIKMKDNRFAYILVYKNNLCYSKAVDLKENIKKIKESKKGKCA